MPRAQKYAHPARRHNVAVAFKNLQSYQKDLAICSATKTTWVSGTFWHEES